MWYDICYFLFERHKYLYVYVLQRNVLKVVGGETGKANGEEVLLEVCRKLFHDNLISSMTWTGKSGDKTKKKIKFKSFSNTRGLMFELVLAADKSFNEKKFEKILIYKVLKYGYRAKKTTPNESISELVPIKSIISSSNESTGAEHELVSNTQQQTITGPPASHMLPPSHNMVSGPPAAPSAIMNQPTFPHMVTPQYTQYKPYGLGWQNFNGNGNWI